MSNQEHPEEFLERLRSVSHKRAKAVIEHILQHGFVTTEELRISYGYGHPPRGARDVRELGIPLETFRVKDSRGRSIGAYRFSDPSQLRDDRLAGRRTFSKKFKARLVEITSSKCGICLQQFDGRYLQIDHRVPYEVAGDDPNYDRAVEEYMLLCGSCNRAKSWSCEHCLNWKEIKNPGLCWTCYWAQPGSYKHIALQPIRRLDVVWAEDEVEIYEKLRSQAQALEETMPDHVKAVIKSHIEGGELDNSQTTHNSGDEPAS